MPRLNGTRLNGAIANNESEPQMFNSSKILMMSSRAVREAAPAHINPVQWNQSLGYARQACARIFRDGGSPADAVRAFGFDAENVADWSRAVELVAESLTRAPARRAA